MCYISMDSSWLVLQINGKIFQIMKLFFEIKQFFKNNSGVSSHAQYVCTFSPFDMIYISSNF